MKVVLDTDVVVAALRSPRGASAGLLRAARAGRVRLLASVPLAMEYEAACSRAEHRLATGFSTIEIGTFLDALIALCEPTETYFLWRPQLRDPADEMVLEAAVNGGADALVTFNLRDFAAARRFALEVLRPSQAFARIER